MGSHILWNNLLIISRTQDGIGLHGEVPGPWIFSRKSSRISDSKAVVLNLGQLYLPDDIWQCPMSLSQPGFAYYCYPVGRGQGCCYTSYNAQDSPLPMPHKELPNYSIVLLLRISGLEGVTRFLVPDVCYMGHSLRLCSPIW